MPSSLKPALIALAAVTALVLTAALARFQVLPAIALYSGPYGTVLGIMFWTIVALASAALPVRMPGGVLLDVSSAPIVSAMSLGGPAAVVWVAAVGCTQARELRREVPWYGVLANHASIATPAVFGALLIQAFPQRQPSVALDLLITGLGAVVYLGGNLLINSGLLALKDGVSYRRALTRDKGAYASMIALAPLAWLMARIYMEAWWAVLLFAVPLYTTRVAYQSFVEVREMFTQTVRSLAEAVDKRDPYTSNHSNRVQEIALDIGRVLRLRDEELEALEWGGLLHDIGKIGVRDDVLKKQERLTREEREHMNKHPILGAEIIRPVERLAPELPIILHHHEWFNGSGYPDRLVGDQIPKLARILHVADAFEAMTAVRPYRMTPLTAEQALGELRKFGGIQFDPDVVDAFVQTHWAADVPDPGRPREWTVPLIADTAGAMAAQSVSLSRLGGGAYSRALSSAQP